MLGRFPIVLRIVYPSISLIFLIVVTCMMGFNELFDCIYLVSLCKSMVFAVEKRSSVTPFYMTSNSIIACVLRVPSPKTNRLDVTICFYYNLVGSLFITATRSEKDRKSTAEISL